MRSRPNVLEAIEPPKGGKGSIDVPVRELGRQSWRRVLGLASRSLVLTAQRWLDLWAAFRHIREGAVATNVWMLTAVLVLTTLVMGFTLSKHWSACRQGRQYGALVGIMAAVLQIAPLCEMIDKIFTHGRPPLISTPAPSTNAREPFLQAKPRWRSRTPKGSPGENVMRGLRKMSVVNLLQAMVSLWFHAFELLPVFPPTSDFSTAMNPNNVQFLLCSCCAALLGMALGVADLVLYIWVDDAFVRSNKKLVTCHYLLEILTRMPVLVLFQATYSRLHSYHPTCLLFSVDLLVNSALLLAPRMCQTRRASNNYQEAYERGELKICNKQTLMQFFYSLVVSLFLFFFNVVFFDPGQIFGDINRLFIWVKIGELAVMMHLIDFARNEDWLHCGLPPSFEIRFKLFVGLCFLGNLFFTVFLVPRRRELAVSQMAAAGQSPGLLRRQDSYRNHLLRRQVSDLSSHAGTPSGDGLQQRSETLWADGESQGQSLDNMETVFELLWLLSQAACERNRSKVMDIVVEELWLLALCWDGAYTDSQDATIYIAVDPQRQRTITYGRAGEENVSASIVGNTISVAGGKNGSSSQRAHCIAASHGVFDGSSIRWDGGEVWERSQKKPDFLRLILPQLALALRWDVPLSSEGDQFKNQGGMLLHFLIQYSVISQKTDFLSDLYWALYCLSSNPGNGADRYADIYHRTRRDLVHYLGGNIENGSGDVTRSDDVFLQKARQRLHNQRVVWWETEELLKHSGRSSGGGAWIYRTQELRSALVNWRSRPREDADETDIDEESLMTPTLNVPGQPGQPSRSPIDLQNVPEQIGGEHISLPIDPKVQFLGIVISETEVIASKQAPVMLTCRTRPVNACSPRVDRRPDNSGVQTSPVEQRQKILFKNGDDLRQDQLMLQLMELMGYIWQHRLPKETARLLKLDLSRVLAVTPNVGYVKCEPDAVPLSEALHASQGHLEQWLEDNCPKKSQESVLDRFCGSVAASCVVTYVLGIGDRHLENICITPQGLLFHVDFGFVLGDDPKPIAPPVRLPQQVAQALRRTERLEKCFDLAHFAYLALRPYAGLLGSVLRLTAEAGGAGCSKLAQNAFPAIAGVHERLRVDQADDERASAEFLCLVRESSEGLASILLDKIHAAGLFWR